jgi:hypothetical protein
VSTWNCEQKTADVRLPKCADRDAWLKLWADHHAYGAQGESSPPPEVSDTTWVNFFNPTMPMHALLAEREGGVVGFAHVVVHPTSLRGSPGFLFDIFYQRCGYGREAFEAVRGLRQGTPRAENASNWPSTASWSASLRSPQSLPRQVRDASLRPWRRLPKPRPAFLRPHRTARF